MKALIVGSAACVWDDVARARELFEPDAVFAVNNMIHEWDERLDYACTLHAVPNGHFKGIRVALRMRAARGLNRPVTCAHKPDRDIDRVFDDWAGSSGLFALRVAIAEGFTRCVLAGIPMERSEAHFFDAKEWAHAAMYRKGWTQHIDEIKPVARSMSGWTRELLGEPDKDWFAT